MMKAPTHFLLSGCTSYLSRGDEAIVRGTMAVLRNTFGDDISVTLASFGKRKVIAKQAAAEYDKAIHHVPFAPALLSRPGIETRLNKAIHTHFPFHPTMLTKPLHKARASVVLAADNYSLYYGIPQRFIEIDRYIQSFQVPQILWGASIGPFDDEPEFAREMLSHISRMSCVLARESLTVDYLRRNSIIGNVREVADPAFVMEPMEPPAWKIDFPIAKDIIGINLSALLARYVVNGDMHEWIQRCTEVVVAVSRTFGRDIILIPHATSSDIQNNDWYLLNEVAKVAKPKVAGAVIAVGDNLSAQESKWLIAKCSVFAGARTHSTIAAISSKVPTLSIAYSTKAKGINQDIFGSQEYCIDMHDIRPETIVAKIGMLIERGEGIKEHLTQRLPDIGSRALLAGSILREIIDTSTNSHYS
ncbi:MAG: polysaccharide pyruvyl transferase family protein [Armatimonadota bacterium]|nr:polysaccharide pyruvyl transferase family protein [bacterium]